MDIPTVQFLWRISKHADLSGAGGKISSGRWHSKGSPVVYLAESPAGALLESLVHLEYSQRRLPETYTLLKVAVPANFTQEEIEIQSSPDWIQNLQLSQPLGNAWLASLRTPLARVPSAVVPQSWNVLLNPAHEAASRLSIVSTTLERYDRRLFKFAPAST